MNFYNQFIDQWNVRFEGSIAPPQLDYLKADQFGSLVDQKRALEIHEAKLCANIDDLKRQLSQKNFVAEYVQKCIQKLGAISQVFNEFEQCDSKSSSSSGTNSRQHGPSVSPPLHIGDSLLSQSNKVINSGNTSTFQFFPQSIASSLIHSASPLFAAAATSASQFLLPSAMPSFPYTESLKLEPDGDPLPVRSSTFLLPQPGDRNTVYASTIARMATANTSLSSSTYANQQAHQSAYHSSSGSTLHTNYHISSSAGSSSPLSCCYPATRIGAGATAYEHNRRGTVSTAAAHHAANGTANNDDGGERADAAAAAAAAHAVAAALGLDIRSAVAAVSNNSVVKSQQHLLSTATSFLHPTSTNGLDNVSNKGSSPGAVDAASASNERPYQCETCLRSFAVKAGLVQHMRTHTDERPYPCLDCGRAFKQKIQLTTHMRVHSGERPYGCRLCGKLFRQQSHVVQHLRTHTGEKPHKCYQCGKAFRQKYSLISHQRRMCRNRATANPIAAGMTMWISPGAGGDTCNLVKEFSPTKAVGSSVGIHQTHNLMKNISRASTSPSLTSPTASGEVNSSLIAGNLVSTSAGVDPPTTTVTMTTTQHPTSPFITTNSGGLFPVASHRSSICSNTDDASGVVVVTPTTPPPAAHRLLLPESSLFRQRSTRAAPTGLIVNTACSASSTPPSYPSEQHLSVPLCSNPITRLSSEQHNDVEDDEDDEEDDDYVDDDYEEEYQSLSIRPTSQSSPVTDSHRVGHQ